MLAQKLLEDPVRPGARNTGPGTEADSVGRYVIGLIPVPPEAPGWEECAWLHLSVSCGTSSQDVLTAPRRQAHPFL